MSELGAQNRKNNTGLLGTVMVIIMKMSIVIVWKSVANPLIAIHKHCIKKIVGMQKK